MLYDSASMSPIFENVGLRATCVERSGQNDLSAQSQIAELTEDGDRRAEVHPDPGRARKRWIFDDRLHMRSGRQYRDKTRGQMGECRGEKEASGKKYVSAQWPTRLATKLHRNKNSAETTAS